MLSHDPDFRVEFCMTKVTTKWEVKMTCGLLLWLYYLVPSSNAQDVNTGSGRMQSLGLMIGKCSNAYRIRTDLDIS